MKASMKTVLFAVLCGGAVPALAAPPNVLMVSNCWIRTLPGNLPSGGYFSVMNMSDDPIDLTGIKTDAFGMAMLHETRAKGSTSTMAMVKKATVPANGTLAFAPGGYHVMLEQPKQPLQIGTTVPLTFTFGDGEQVTAQCAVKGPDAMSD
ncbi:copper transporter [Burkholderia sp. WAC0059]|uniref:copper chaperone PCu(A)C n=1 Tax=Burkholderia sp. WAC0059 TaxID=2066022 RepID=UPI000C7F60F9|nr:copper chaperone PCu(A)C [Burkholderia sp. WAC0059]PLZ03462.1 copper transporter [Burkholderia sp. WAC0059]